MRRPEVLVVYLAALLQGLALVSFPSSGTVLQSGFGLSASEYGGIFLPQTAMAIVGSLAGGALAARLGMPTLLALSCLLASGSQVALVGAGLVPPMLVVPTLYLGTGLLGIGFGLAAAPLNSYPARLFPHSASSALVALHTVMGIGLTVGPLLVGGLIAVGFWSGFPLVGIALGLFLAVVSLRVRLPLAAAPDETETPASGSTSWVPLGVFGLVAVLYAFAEGTFSNWASLYVHDALGVAESVAAFAVSGFWGGLTLGRYLASRWVGAISPARLWLAMPVGMAVVFALLPYARGAASGIGLFVLAGLACSAFFPLTVDLASRRYPGREPVVSSLLVAALMVGVGGGSFLLGALRAQLSFESLYRLSMLYPLAAFGLGVLLIVAGRPRAVAPAFEVEES